MADSFYSFSEPLNSGVDFYNADDAKVISIALSGDVSVTVNLTKTAFSAVDLSADTAVTAVAARIVFASANISDLLSATVTAGTTIREGSLIAINATSSLTAVGTKIAYASTAINCTSSVITVGMKISSAASAINSAALVATVATKISYGNTSIPCTSNVSVSALRIRLVSSLISVLGNVTTVPNASTVNARIFLTTIKININTSNSETRAQMIRFSPNITADSTVIRALLLLDGSPLTNQSRTFDISAAPVFIENNNWAGDSSRYYKNSAQHGGSKRTFNAKWSFIPNKSEETVDYRESRNFLKDTAMDSDIHTLTIIRQDESGLTPYTEESVSVFITNFNEKLLRRDLVSGVYYFDCAMTLEEV